MKKLNSLVTLLICTVFVSGCATYSEMKQAENEPLCWGNINAKSKRTEISPDAINYGSQIANLAIPGAYLAGLAVGTAWDLASKTLHAAAATLNPNCYSDKSDSNSFHTSDSKDYNYAKPLSSPSDTPDSNSGEYNRDGIAPNPHR